MCLGACFDEETVERMSSRKKQKVRNNDDWKQIYEAGIQGNRDRMIQKEEARRENCSHCEVITTSGSLRLTEVEFSGSHPQNLSSATRTVWNQWTGSSGELRSNCQSAVLVHHETRREGLGHLGTACEFKGSLELQAGVEDSEMFWWRRFAGSSLL